MKQWWTATGFAASGILKFAKSIYGVDLEKSNADISKLLKKIEVLLNKPEIKFEDKIEEKKELKQNSIIDQDKAETVLKEFEHADGEQKITIAQAEPVVAEDIAIKASVLVQEPQNDLPLESLPNKTVAIEEDTVVSSVNELVQPEQPLLEEKELKQSTKLLENDPLNKLSNEPKQNSIIDQDKPETVLKEFEHADGEQKIINAQAEPIVAAPESLPVVAEDIAIKASVLGQEPQNDLPLESSLNKTVASENTLDVTKIYQAINELRTDLRSITKDSPLYSTCKNLLESLKVDVFIYKQEHKRVHIPEQSQKKFIKNCLHSVNEAQKIFDSYPHEKLSGALNKFINALRNVSSFFATLIDKFNPVSKESAQLKAKSEKAEVSFKEKFQKFKGELEVELKPEDVTSEDSPKLKK